ncbi:MAG: HEAT repeat domain-containing protein [Anaerolineae bacterium]
MSEFERFWTLEEYRRYLDHQDAELRDWAMERIKEQYPERLAESVAPLLADPDALNVWRAAEAVAETGDLRYEGDLLAALPTEPGFLRYKLLPNLGQVRSPTMLPRLMAGLDASRADSPRSDEGHEAQALIEALGHYPDAEARAALWRFVERHPYVDDLSYSAFEGLLRFAGPDDVDALAHRHAQLTPGLGHSWLRISILFARQVGLETPADEAAATLDEGPNQTLAEIEDWLAQWLPWPRRLLADLHTVARNHYRDALPLVAAELRRLAAERGEDLDAWQAAWARGEGRGSYRWRAAYSSRLVEALAQAPPGHRLLHRRAVGLALALLAQRYVDEDDEAALAAAAKRGDKAHRATLFQILGSPRMNVLPDVVERVVALGPEAMSELLPILDEGSFWAIVRAVKAVEGLARAHPGAADEAIPYVLALIERDQSDYLLEPAADALRAIGPAMVAPAAAGLGQGDWTYDIYVQGAIARVPIEASVDAILQSAEGEFSEMEITHLAELGHPRGFDFLYDNYDPDVPEMTRSIYILGVLTGYQGPEMAEWRREVQESRTRFVKAIYEDRDEWLRVPKEEEETAPSPQDTRKKRAEQRKRKQKRARARAQRKAQRRKKKKR